LLAWSLLGGQVAITATPPPLSTAGLGLAASATLSIMLTSWAMIATDAVHPPACATTLIVSLGLLSTARQVGIIVVAVAILVGVNAAGERVVERVNSDIAITQSA